MVVKHTFHTMEKWMDLAMMVSVELLIHPLFLYFNRKKFLILPQDTQPNDGTEKAPLPPTTSVAEADTPNYASKAAVPEAAPIPPPATAAAKAAPPKA